jgi:polysaccharide export outer membrane protein
MERITGKISNFSQLTNSFIVRISFYSCSLILVLFLSSCGAYKQNIMFRANDTASLKEQAGEAEGNYVIRKGDILQLEVFTNQGEKIIDPNRESFKESAQSQPDQATAPTYLVDASGLAKFPMLNEINLESLTLRKAEEILQKEYTKFYEEPFVVLKFTNKRVFVLGAPGGQVIPLTNENVKLTEILALAKGVSNDAKAKNIRVLRGDVVYLADFSTIEGYLKSNMTMQPGDIVYVEPVRRPFIEAVREYGPIISIITSVATIIIVLNQQ